MTDTMIILIIILIGSLFLGMPVSSSLGFTAIMAILLFMEPISLNRLASIAYTQGTSINQMVAPLFIVMAEFLARGGIATDIYDVLNRMMRKIKGGLAISTTLACTVFAALCGSSPATAASVGRISISQMINRGYSPDFATGTVAAGGSLGVMIPPSLAFVLYGIITETSIAKLFMAGLLPGIMISLMFCISILIRVRLNPSLIDVSLKKENQGADPVPEIEKPPTTALDSSSQNTSIKSGLKATIPSFALILIVLGTLYTGTATPTESAGYGAVGAIILVIFLGRMRKGIFIDALKASARTSAMILFIMIFGLVLAHTISHLGIAQNIATAIVGSGTNRWVVMIMLIALWYIMGALMDPGSMVILTVPFIYPSLMQMGFDPIWIGVIATLCVEVGMLTPPVGLNLFVLRGITDVSMGNIIKGALPYVLVLTLAVAILCIFPGIALFLPSQM